VREARKRTQETDAEGLSPKDLRDTYGSWLITAGVQLAYVSDQLGHADTAVTAKHYARWTQAGAYREPLTVTPGEVPADLLAQLPKRHHFGGDGASR
jgi:integrase